MGQVLHGSARTTAAICRAIQLRQVSVRAAAKRYSVSPTTIQKFVDAYNHARWLKTLRSLTPYEHVHQIWTKEPERFRLDPSHHIPGPDSGH